MSTETKRCSKCREDKTLDQFYPSKRDGTTFYCRECTKAYTRERYRAKKANPTPVAQP